MSKAIPILVVGDGLSQPSGLGRISRDLTLLLHEHASLLGIRVAHLGYKQLDGGWPFPTFNMLDRGNYGQDDLKRTWWRFAGEQAGVVFTIWDPSRCWGIEHEAQALPVQMWGYVPIDGVNTHGVIGGPAGDVMRRYQKLIGYGRWGAGVIAETIGKDGIPYLPHGLDLNNWYPRTHKVPHLDEGIEKDAYLPKQFISAVCTNQPRKDLGALFSAWSICKREDSGLKFWLHTDVEIGEAWSVPELAAVYGFGGDLTVTTDLDDAGLAELYSRSWVTVLATLGEGYGYPAVESMATGTPCISTDDHAGGAELIPREDWRVPARGTRVEGPYCIVRPVISPEQLARKIMWAYEWVRREPDVSREYCVGAVAHLGWDRLAPRWLSLFKRELATLRQ